SLHDALPISSSAVRRDPAEATRVSRAERGVLPRRLRARPEHPRRIRDRSAAGARRTEAAARRVALPPPFEPALPADAEPPRLARFGARVRPAADRRAARLRSRAAVAVGDRP